MTVVRNLRALLILQVLLLLAGGLMVVSGGQTRSVPEPASAEATPVTLLTADAGIPLAMVQAARWDPDATLVSVAAILFWPKEVPAEPPTSVTAAGYMTYVFQAEEALLTIYLDRRTGAVFGSSEGTLDVPFSGALEVADIQVNADTAVLAAERLGGREYRAACPDARKRTFIQLQRGADGGLVWVVRYATAAEPTKTQFRVTVDASSGDVGEVLDLKAPCPVG